MLKGKCINNKNSSVLSLEKQYFLFPYGNTHYYVSNFPNLRSNMGCFQKERFTVFEDDIEENNQIDFLQPEEASNEQLSLF